MQVVVILVLGAASFGAANNPINGVLIKGGEEAIPHEFPWQVSIQHSQKHFCGGIIYNAVTVITTAQCGEVASAGSLRVVAGKHNLRINETTEQFSNVVTVVRHPDYNGDIGFANDIAILKLETPFNFNSSAVSKIDIAPKLHTARGNAIVSGWGITRDGGSISDILRKVEIPVITDEDCREFYGANMIHDSMICAVFPGGGKDACQGDTGGPLLASDLENGDYYLAGIVSWGYGCVGLNYPGVYTEVSHFNDFIEINSKFSN